MKVYLREQAGLSRAMARVARALGRHAPSHVQVVDDESDADFVLIHTIGYPETEEKVFDLVRQKQRFGIVMYCFRTTQRPSAKEWLGLWQMADVVWSYYDLESALIAEGSSERFPFYYAPLGVDADFASPSNGEVRDLDVMTSGFVTGPCAEAIEEVLVAAEKNAMQAVHLGPIPAGMTTPFRATSVHCIPDWRLATYYRRSRWVSGLRHGEGFELPALEGLCCGARPILFDRPETRRWYGDHAVYVPECDGQELIRLLLPLLTEDRPVTMEERNVVINEFQWESIVKGFWNTVLDV